MMNGIHPQMQWISQSGRLMMPIMISKINQVGKTYHLMARQQISQSVGQIAMFRKHFGQHEEDAVEPELPCYLGTDMNILD